MTLASEPEAGQPHADAEWEVMDEALPQEKVTGLPRETEETIAHGGNLRRYAKTEVASPCPIAVSIVGARRPNHRRAAR